jgi:hypothetical protein
MSRDQHQQGASKTSHRQASSNQITCTGSKIVEMCIAKVDFGYAFPFAASTTTWFGQQGSLVEGRNDALLQVPDGAEVVLPYMR